MSADILQLLPMDKAPNRIRELRLARKLSQQKVADAINVSKVTISQLERGEMQLTQHYMSRIANALGCFPADLLTKQQNPYQLTAEELKIIQQMRAASSDDRAKLSALADVVIPFHIVEPYHELKPKRANDG